MKAITTTILLATTAMAALPANPHAKYSAATAEASPPWWTGVASLSSVPTALRSVADALEQSAADAGDAAASAARAMRDKAADALDRLGRLGSAGKPDLTLYQTLRDLKGAGKFAKLVDDFPELVDALNGTDREHTLFLPLDDAFDKIPDKYKKPGRETLEFFLTYHVVSGRKKAGQVLASYTLESEALEARLGNEKQRIHVGASLAGVKLNGYSKITAVDIEATNGVIHTISDVLVPPPPVGVIITLFPAHFSTLLLAYEKTNFVKFIHAQRIQGSTVIAPSNTAFERLGAEANAFLFNSKDGVKYLDAILKYGIVPNATVYSDAFYDKRSSSHSVAQATHQEHYSLDTFLPGASLGVDIATVLGFRIININGFTGVSFHDGIGSNGVLHVVDSVVFPPHKKHTAAGQVSIEDIKEMLGPYIAQDAQDAQEPISGEL